LVKCRDPAAACDRGLDARQVADSGGAEHFADELGPQDRFVHEAFADRDLAARGWRSCTRARAGAAWRPVEAAG
jgi:hypothetical protein